MKRNKDYLYFILAELEENYGDPISLEVMFNKWNKDGSRTKAEATDFGWAGRLLAEEGFVLELEGNRFGNITWKGYDLLDSLRGIAPIM